MSGYDNVANVAFGMPNALKTMHNKSKWKGLMQTIQEVDMP